MDSDKSSDVPVSLQMATLHLPCDDMYAVATDLKVLNVINTKVMTHVSPTYRRPALFISQKCR